jgi:cytochrome c-type biogenesis protein CcmH/NrfF
MRLVILTLLVPLALIAPVGASEPRNQQVERDAAKIFDRVMSPYCPGRTLATCGSGAAEELRQDIKHDLRRGLPPAEIESALYRKFGNSIRGVPEMRGVGLVAWLGPAALFGATGTWLVLWLRRRGANHSDDPLNVEPISQTSIDRLDDELAEI